MPGAACPACGSTQLDLLEGRTVACQKCGSHFELSVCPSCGGLVSEGMDTCPSCGRGVSLIPQVIDRHTDQRVPHWLEDVRDQAEELKTNAAAAAATRMQTFEEIHRRREAWVRQEEHARRNEQRVILLVSLGAAVAVLLLCVLIAILL